MDGFFTRRMDLRSSDIQWVRGGVLNQDQYESWSRISAIALKVLGIIGIMFITVYWAISGKFEFSFLPFFGTLAGVGQGLDILSELSKKERKPKP
jgi:hypothetical protein